MRLAALAAQSRLVLAYQVVLPLDQTWDRHQQCIDMLGSSTFRPDMESSLIVSFEKGHAGLASLVVFELGDEHLGGMSVPGTRKVSSLTARPPLTAIASV